MSDNIKVAVKIKPLIPTEKNIKLPLEWVVQDNNIYQIDPESGQRNGELYSFDHIFNHDKTNDEVYEDVVKKFVESSVNGLNATIFAYGQTSSGKTYTMLGGNKEKGIVQLAVEHIFKLVAQSANKKFLFRVSYIEIYNEKINDLLNPQTKDLKIRENYGVISLNGVKEDIVTTREEIFDLLKKGAANRRIGSTNMNERSSRSHTIFKIEIQSFEGPDSGNKDCPIQISCLNLVDLAGSERVCQTKATGVRLKEGGHINKSLSALGLVIRQLSDSQEFVNFRDSKLTRLLQHSLGGNSMTLIIATITLISIDDTNSTLAFAQRAKAVKNKPQINEILTDSAITKRYAQLNGELKTRLEEQLLKNEQLEMSKEESCREIDRLQKQMKMLHLFQHGDSDKLSVPKNKRRHTIGSHLHQKHSLKAITEELEDDEISSNNQQIIEPSTPYLKTPNVINLHRASKTPVSLEEFIPYDNDSPFSTPKKILRSRIELIQRDYEELRVFTRDENHIQNEISQENDRLKELLRNETKKMSELKEQRIAEEELLTDHLKNKFKTRENELLKRISELEGEVQEKNTDTTDLKIDFDDLKYLQDKLITLQELLNNNYCFDDQHKEMPNPVKQILESFNLKVSTSKSIIEREIWKQVNSFNQMNDTLNESLIPNELDSFNDLLKELSDFQNDVSVDFDSTKGESIENLKNFIKIYESLLKKNELIGICSQKISTLQEQIRDNKCDHEETIDYYKQLVEQYTTNNAELKEEIERITVEMKNSKKRETEVKNNQATICGNYEQEILYNEKIIAQYKNEINDLKSEKETLKEKILTTQQQCDSFKNELSHLKTAVEDYEKEIDKLKIEHNNNLARINSIQMRENEHVEQINLLNSQIDNLQLKLNGQSRLKTTVEEYERELGQLRIKLKKYDYTVQESKEHQEKINSLQCEIDCLQLRLNEQSQLKTTVEEYEKEIDLLKIKLKTNDVNKMQKSEEKINFLQGEIDNLQLKLKLKATEYEKEIDELKIKLKKINSMKMQESEGHVVKINLLESEIGDLRLKLVEQTQLEATVQEYQKEIEKLKMELNQYENNMSMKMQENEENVKKINFLQRKIDTLQSMLTDNNDNRTTDLKNCIKMHENVLSNVIEHFIKQEKNLLLMKQTQDQRDYFKNVRKDLRDITSNLKSQLQLFHEQKKYDLLIVNEMLLKSCDILKQYYDLEKSFLESHIVQLESSSKNYLEEIAVLKRNQEDLQKRGNLMKSQIDELNKKLAYKERMIVETDHKMQSLQEKLLSSGRQECTECPQLQSKISELKQKNRDLMGRYVDIRNELGNEQELRIKEREKKAKLAYSELITHYQENEKYLQMKLAKYENATSMNKQSVEIQCELIDAANTVSIEKYESIKRLCRMRNDEIKRLNRVE